LSMGLRSPELPDYEGTPRISASSYSPLDARIGSTHRRSHRTSAQHTRDILRRSSQAKIACPCGSK
jgi:hypothetical protein